MEADFWHQRWDENKIGFHLAEVNPYLPRFWPALNLPVGSRVLVPLCGKSLDLLWLAQQGYEVIGVEVSPVAVKAFFAENHLAPVLSEGYGLEVWKAGEISLFCGDFFDLQPQELGEIDAVYDRAAFIALPCEMRQHYATHLNVLCPAPRPRLLITLEYEQAQVSGPPFAVTEQEAHEIYDAGFQVKRVFAEDIIEKEAKFREKGLDVLIEAVYLLSEK